ncbi:MAG: Rpn family recombination-promoting nuclease/putative transposase [Clostridia bacterium]|nr:Rpn family recombination-promoting nuclease/putative transposase [Clostridia bacterium]
MDRLEREQREREHQEDLARLRGLRPIDDDFMRCLFRDNKPLVERVLRIITGIDDLVVLSFTTQKDMKRLVGARSVCLDVYATDSAGRKYDLEIQRDDQGAGTRRARYHASSMDIENLDAGQDYDELPETYVIFITETDVIGGGLPCYRIERVNLDTGAPFDDGAHILYVNGAWRDETPLGQLMHDFSCSDASQMRDPLLQKTTKYYKETEEGVASVCRAFEEVRLQGIQIGMQRGLQQGIQQGLQQGIQQGIQQGMQQGMQKGLLQGTQQTLLQSIRALQSTMGISANRAMELLNVPAAERDRYARLVLEAPAE